MLKAEADHRHVNELKRRIKTAKLPPCSDLNVYDHAVDNGLPKTRLNQLRELNWLDQIYNIMLGGICPTKKIVMSWRQQSKANANIIVTNNLKHFPAPYLASFGLVAKNADDLVTDLIDLNPQKAVKAFLEMVSHKRNPPLNELQVLDRLRERGLTQAADYLHSQI